MELLGQYLSKLDLYAIFTVLLTWANLLLGTAIAFRTDEAQRDRRSFRGFLAYAFPREILFHRSSLVDWGFAVAQKLSFPILIAPALAACVAIGHWTMGVAAEWIGPPQAESGAKFWASLAFSIVGLTLAADFADFWTHRLMHRVWWLWEFHKVHHSAEVMALGITARRNHPVEDVIRLGSASILSGIVFGLFAYFVDAGVDEVTFLGIDVFLAIKLLSFYHLKHGHAHLRFGPVLERILVSPAQHQLHHSSDPRHYDSNFGTLVAFWDLLYGSWRRSEPRGGYRLGLADDEHKDYDSVARLYYLPFVKIWRVLRRRQSSPEPYAWR